MEHDDRVSEEMNPAREAPPSPGRWGVAATLVAAVAIVAAVFSVWSQQNLRREVENASSVALHSDLVEKLEAAAERIEVLAARLDAIEGSVAADPAKAGPQIVAQVAELAATAARNREEMDAIQRRLLEVAAKTRGPVVLESGDGGNEIESELQELESSNADRDDRIAELAESIGQQLARIESLEETLDTVPRSPHGSFWDQLQRFIAYGERDFKEIRGKSSRERVQGSRTHRSTESFSGAELTLIVRAFGATWCDAILARDESYVQVRSAYARARENVQRVLPVDWTVREISTRDFEAATQVLGPDGSHAFVIGFGGSPLLGDRRLHVTLIRFGPPPE